MFCANRSRPRLKAGATAQGGNDVTELIKLSATEVVAHLKARRVSPTEALDASIARIEAVDGEVNALPIRCFDRARDRAKAIEAAPETGGPLAGLPIAVKDYNDVGGVRTTYGSPIFADNTPARSDATVERLEANGANPVGKSNVPEWAGGHTFNPVNGLTRNPWNLGRSAGGSSGGSAAALASGQVWLATGNDLGGSLRTPAGFNGVVGIRPSPGVVPRGARLPAFDTLWVEGPMARSVADAALMLDAGAGRHADDPLAIDPTDSFAKAAAAPRRPVRIGYSPSLGGAVPVAKEVTAVTDAAMAQLGRAGVDVTADSPDFTGAFDCFQTLRSTLLATMMGDMLDEHRDRIADAIVANVEMGFDVTPDQLFTAERTRWELHHRMAAFFETHDVLACPTASVAPFPVERPFVEEIDGVPCKTYIDWFAVTFIVTLTACPVVSLPCGFTPNGLPIGVQLVGRPRGEAELLSAAAWMEAELGANAGLPIDPRPAA